MKTEYLKELGLTDEQIQKVMAENGKDVEAQKAKTAAKESELATANQTITDLQDTVKKFDGVDVDGLKRAAADWEAKYNADFYTIKGEIEMANKLIFRCDWAAYMGCGETPTYNLIGEGFSELSESKNPKEYSRKYVHMKTERTDLVGFAPSMSYSMDAYSEDPVALEIMNIHDGELIGTDAVRPIVSVNLWKPGKTAGCFEATKRNYAVIPDSKGSGTEALVYTGTLKAQDDPIQGEFNPETKTFTEAADAPVPTV